MAVTVVVPTLGRPTLERCLASVDACRPRASEVLVVVQGDVAAAERYVGRGLCRDARVIHDPGRGTSSSTNRGIRGARQSTVLVTHDDCEVDPTWVGVAAALAREHPGAIVTGRVLPDGDPARIPSCKTDPRPQDFTGTLQVGALYPNNMVLPKERVLELGGFDERFTPSEAAEDCDLCYRWLKAGLTMRYEPSLVVRHNDWRTSEELERMYVRYARGSGAVYGKHLRRGDFEIVGFLVQDLRAALWGAVERLCGATPRWADYRQAIALGLPGGLLFGLRHLGGDGAGSPWRLRRWRPPASRRAR